MNREKCINRNITIASAIISGVNILTFYNAFYKCFKFKYVDDFISLLCLLFSLMILINIKQHIRTIEFCLWYSILFIICNYSAPRLGYINFWSKQRKYNFCFIIALLRKVDNFSM